MIEKVRGPRATGRRRGAVCLLALIASMSAMVAGCTGGEPPAEGAERKLLRIEGMTCENCERHVREELEKLPGVVVVTVDAGEGTAVIAAPPGSAGEEALEKAVASAGYRLRGIGEEAEAEPEDR